MDDGVSGFGQQDVPSRPDEEHRSLYRRSSLLVRAPVMKRWAGTRVARTIGRCSNAIA